MTIATRLKLNILFSAAAVILMSAVFLTAFMIEKRASEQVVFADTLSRGMYDLIELAESSIQYPGGRPQTQWRLKRDSLERILKESVPLKGREELVLRMREDLKDLNLLYGELMSSYSGLRPVGRGQQAGETQVLRAKREQLADLISLKSRDIAGIANRIAIESTKAVQRTSREIAFLFSIFASLVLMLSIRFSLVMRKVIEGPINRLDEGTRTVQTGDLDHRIPVLSEDELGRLSASFNQMTEHLKETTVSRDELVREVGERRQTEDELRKSQAQLQTIIENIDEGIIVSDLDGLLFHWNRAALMLHGFTRDEEWRRRLPEFDAVYELSTLDGHVLSIDQWPLARILRGESLSDMETGIRRKDMEWERIFNYGGTLVRDTNGRAIMAVITISDITERKKAEEEIRRFNTELEQLVGERTAKLESVNRELESFSYSVSHDLRAPLRAIEGFTRILGEDYSSVFDDEGKRVMSVITENTTRMGKLIDDLLAFSRVGRYEIKDAPVDMNAMVRSVIDEIVPPVDAGRITFVIEPLVKAYADPSLIRQVWINLISNAVKFSAKRNDPRIEVTSSVREGKAWYSVRDNGVGFDMAYVDKLFGVFQRLHSGREFEGTGVGLAIAQRIVLRHGGEISAKAEAGMGATFSFSLPLYNERT